MIWLSLWFLSIVASFVAGCVYKTAVLAAEQKAKDALKKAVHLS